MKIDLFENKYKPSNAVKIFFVDIVCFLLVTFLSIGICYAYLSDHYQVSGTSTTAKVGVQYQYNASGSYVSVEDIYAKVNGGATEKLEDITITPGDKLTIVGRAVNTSNVAVYVLAKLEIVINDEPITVWYNIGTNDPTIVNGTQTGADTPGALAEADYKVLTTQKMGDHDVYQVGAGSLGVDKYKELAIPYEFKGADFDNDDVISSIKLTLHVHQKNHLSTASDYALYKQYTVEGYTTDSIYAAHYITGNKLQ